MGWDRLNHDLLRTLDADAQIDRLRLITEELENLLSYNKAVSSPVADASLRRRVAAAMGYPL